MIESCEPESIEEAVRLLEADIGIEQGFLEGLVHEDDWSFVIKSHALLEVSVSHLLAKALADDRLVSVFANLETSNGKSGKLAFASALDVLDADARRFLKSFKHMPLRHS